MTPQIGAMPCNCLRGFLACSVKKSWTVRESRLSRHDRSTKYESEGMRVFLKNSMDPTSNSLT